MARARIHVTGIVQGVGFRPFVYREAVARGLAGWVLNASDGVHVEVAGPREAVADFARTLREDAPAAARVEDVRVAWDADAVGTSDTDGAPAKATADAAAFEIRHSEADAARTTLVSPDIATCPDCLRELFNPADRRYHYPFINCTNCGPRFTIIRDLPYDRPATSMAAFPLCPECAAEYADPLDRRFHAQPDACFACGPHITWRERGASGAGSAAAGGALPPCAGDDGAPEGVPAPSGGPGVPAVGRTCAESDAIIGRCAELLAQGGIVAVKGLGGFHLACNAADDAAVRELRRRKRRSNKPLAVMVRDLADAQALCHVGPAEQKLLCGSVRPIVLLRRRQNGSTGSAADGDPSGTASVTPSAQPRRSRQFCPQHEAELQLPARLNEAEPAPAPVLAPAVAFDLPELGVMLPYTPLQHLLLAACADCGVEALVMTSGNLSEEPIETDDALAWEHLVEGGIADALLGNDRAILSRYDDSVVRVVGGAVMPVRRARGYAPQPLPLPAAAQAASPATAAAGALPALLACGAEQKATFAYTREDADGAAQCFLSQHVGDIENAETMDAWHEARRRFAQLFDLTAQALACDAHPRYLSSQWARAEARKRGLPLIEVQHHHAHIAAVLAEAAAEKRVPADARVIGLAFDGTGAGAVYRNGRLELDGTIWGGEVLIASLTGFTRAAHLRAWRLPGGAASVRDARRNAFALLSDYGLLDHPAAQAFLDALDPDVRSLTATMLDRNINSPTTTSMGRLFDAAAALLAICGQATYEGEPACALEAAAWRAVGDKDAAGALQTAADAVFTAQDLAAFAGETTSSGDVAPVRKTSLAGKSAQEDGAAAVAHEGTAGHDVGNASAAVSTAPSAPLPPSAALSATAPTVLDPGPVLLALLNAHAAGATPELLALAFHEAVAQAAARATLRLSAQPGIRTAALSGGVFMNRLLAERVTQLLRAAGLTVLTPRTVPVNDGCIAYGQAAVARVRLAAGLA